MIVGITVLTYLSSGSMIKSLMMATLGLILGGVGMDAISGKYRFTYGFQTLADGVGLVPLVMGLFGVSEVLENLEREFKRDILVAKFRGLFPTAETGRSAWPILRGTGLGFFLGLIPGGGAIVASFASYAIEKKLAKHPEEFGQGAIQGSRTKRRNSAASGNFIPLLTLGIPCNAVMAILLGALMIRSAAGTSPHGGPQSVLGILCT
jgi:putative tricarboxylic transport membrane protein